METTHEEPAGKPARDSASTEDIKLLQQLNAQTFQAEQNRDTGFLKQILTAGFTLVRSSGKVSTRDEMIQGLNDQASNPYLSRHVTDIQVRLYNGCAVVMSVLVTEEDKDGERIRKHFRNLKVFVRDGEKWRCDAWQVTRSDDGAPAPSH